MMEDPGSAISEEKKSKTIPQNLRSLINAIQIEPVVFLFGLAKGFEDVFTKNLIIDKVCSVQLQYDDDICANLDSGQYEDEQNQVQKLSSLCGMWRHFTEYLPGVVTVFLLAALGESRGLKLPLLVTIFGALLKVLCILLNALFWKLSTVFIVLSFLPYSFCGGYAGFFMSVYAYIGLTCDKKSRTTRLASITVLEFGAMSIGIIIAPSIFNTFGYLGVFLSASLTYIIILGYIVLFLKNHKPYSESDSSDRRKSENLMDRLKSSFTTAFKKRENRDRAKVIGHISAIGLYVCIMGLGNYYYLYSRKKFSWDYESYSLWDAINNPANLIGTIIILPSLSYKWNVDDTIIGLIGYVSRMWQYMIMATAPVGWVMYVATLASICGGMISASSRSALSKMVPSSEITSVFAVVSALESIVPVVDNPIFTIIYNATLDIFPGTVFAIGSVLSASGCFLYMWLYYPFQENSKYKTHTEDNMKMKIAVT